MILSPSTSRSARTATALICALAIAAATATAGATNASAATTPSTATASTATSAAPDQVVIGFDASTTSAQRAAVERRARLGDTTTIAHLTRLADVARGANPTTTLSTLRRTPGVAYAAPNVVAHAAALAPFIPDDSGSITGHGAAGGWQNVQWNFLAPDGVNAPDAWANLIAAGHPGGKGVIIAVLDTGIAYENRGRLRRSPDFAASQFVSGYDFVDHSRFPDDRNGHGTHVAGTIAEETNNRVGLTGLAYGAKLMPVRVLDSAGDGTAAVIAQGVRYAAQHGANVINLSLEFSLFTRASDIPELISAIRYAHRRGALVVAASGNEADATIAYPARAPDVVAVGATTADGCVADYSNSGPGLALVAPGGGDDAPIDDPHCNPSTFGRPIEQVTFPGATPGRFGIPNDYVGTSMAVAHVSAVAALVIASGVIGHHPSPEAVLARIEATARHLGAAGSNTIYGAGLIDAATATTPGPPVPGPAVTATATP